MLHTFRISILLILDFTNNGIVTVHRILLSQEKYARGNEYPSIREDRRALGKHQQRTDIICRQSYGSGKETLLLMSSLVE